MTKFIIPSSSFCDLIGDFIHNFYPLLSRILLNFQDNYDIFIGLLNNYYKLLLILILNEWAFLSISE